MQNVTFDNATFAGLENQEAMGNYFTDTVLENVFSRVLK